jgi:hypothetical protein
VRGGIPGCMYVCLYVCMYVSRAQSNKWGHGETCVTGKRGKKTKRSPLQHHHDYTLFYLFLFIKIFLGEKFVNLYPPNTLYIHYCSEFSKKIKMWYIFWKIWTSKKEKEKERERERERGSTVVVVHKGGFSTCLLNK